MKNKSFTISYHEASFIKEREKMIASIIDAVKDSAKFKTGDYLIAYYPASSYRKTREKVFNSYGAPKKFVVVYTDHFGVPYIKELNKNGDAIGQLLSPLKLDQDRHGSSFSDLEFEIDPDYTDALIFQEEEGFDVSQVQKHKSDLFKEITNHNKSLKVQWRDAKVLIAFLQSLKVGDVVWKSIKSHFTILTIDPIPLTHSGTRIAEDKVFGTAQDSKGNIFDLTYRTFKWSAIYKGRPRSYNELKDPK